MLAAIVAVGAFFVLRPDDTSRRQEERTDTGERAGGGGDPAPDGDTTGDGGAPPEPPRVEEVRIEDGKPVGGVETLRFESGETVRLAFRSDAPDEVHVHGYDRYVELKAGRTARTRFRAELEGIFEIENHDNGELLAELRVEP